MHKVTLHNHKHIGTDDKPLIPNVIFKILCEYLEKNEQGICKEILRLYTLEKEQQRTYDYLKYKFFGIQPENGANFI